jgi:hypothetical protein
MVVFVCFLLYNSTKEALLISHHYSSAILVVEINFSDVLMLLLYHWKGVQQKYASCIICSKQRAMINPSCLPGKEEKNSRSGNSSGVRATRVTFHHSYLCFSSFPKAHRLVE